MKIEEDYFMNACGKKSFLDQKMPHLSKKDMRDILEEKTLMKHQSKSVTSVSNM